MATGRKKILKNVFMKIKSEKTNQNLPTTTLFLRVTDKKLTLFQNA